MADRLGLLGRVILGESRLFLFLADGRGRVVERRLLVVARGLQLVPLVLRRRLFHRDEAPRLRLASYARLWLDVVDLASIRPVATDGQTNVVIGDDAPNRS